MHQASVRIIHEGCAVCGLRVSRSLRAIAETRHAAPKIVYVPSSASFLFSIYFLFSISILLLFCSLFGTRSWDHCINNSAISKWSMNRAIARGGAVIIVLSMYIYTIHRFMYRSIRGIRAYGAYVYIGP